MLRNVSLSAPAHALMSAALLSPEYLPYLYSDDQRYTAYGESALLFGGLALAILLTYRSTAGVYGVLLALLVLLVFHIFSVGFPKWLDPL